jgi:hypothetical protein
VVDQGRDARRCIQDLCEFGGVHSAPACSTDAADASGEP